MEGKSEFTETVNTVGTLLLGALIGAAVALLVAPKSGAQLREDIEQEVSRLNDRLNEVSDELTETVKTRINQLGTGADTVEPPAVSSATPDEEK